MLKAAKNVHRDRDDCSLAIGDLQDLHASGDEILRAWMLVSSRDLAALRVGGERDLGPVANAYRR